MRYTEFRDLIHEELRLHPTGWTWTELKERLSLPYDRPCPSWVARLEQEIGLSRTRLRGPAQVCTIREHAA